MAMKRCYSSGMSKVIPAPEPDQEPKRKSVDLPKQLWKAIEEVAAHETEKRKGSRTTQTQVMQWLLEFALKEYWADEGPPKKAK